MTHPIRSGWGPLHGAVHYQVRPLPKVLEIIQAKDGLGNDWVWKILRTPDGTLWFMTDTTLRYRLKGEKTIRELPPDVPIPHTVPWDMTVDGQGNFWVGGTWSGGGLARRDAAGRWRKWDKNPAGEPLTDVSRIVRRLRGGVWIAAKNASRSAAKSSLYVCDGETLSMLAAPCPLSNAISTICEDSSGRLWAGSDDGLAVLETDGRWRLLNDRPGFSNHHVFFIGEDWKGNIWVNTAHGVFHFLADYKVEVFTPDDGLADWETNGNGFYSDARGEIWIGTVNGLSQYNPTSYSRNTEPPALDGRKGPPAFPVAGISQATGPGLERADAHFHYRRPLLSQPQPYRLYLPSRRHGGRMESLEPPGGPALHQPAGRRPASCC